MKKTLVAAAVLASLGTAAFAQSSVTLYGRIDASLAKTETDNVGFVNNVDADPGALIRSGAHTGSRWGLRGTEDLGGGLKAIFTLEQGFNVDTSTFSNAANQFNRQAFVGLDGGFGTVTVGRQYTLTDTNQANFDVIGLSGYSALGFAFNSNCTTVGVLAGQAIGDCGGAGAGGGRINNSVIYSTPAMGGFGAKLLWSPGEDKTAASSAGQTYGGLLSYAAGPLGLGASWESFKVAGARAVQNYTFGASYDLGAAKLFGMIEGGKNKNTNAKDEGFALGVNIPLGAPSIQVSYARENQKIGGTKISKTNAFEIMGQYPLSKRTYVYAALLKGDYNPTAPALATQKTQNYGLGLVHNF